MTCTEKQRLSSKTQQTTEGEFTCYGKVCCSCSTSLNRRVTIVTNPVISTIYSIDAYHYTRCDFQSSSGEVYSVQHYVIKLSVTCSRSVVFASTPLSSINKTECDDTTEMLLKTDNPMAKRKQTKGQTTVYKTYI
jgi:hypothetical protein